MGIRSMDKGTEYFPGGSSWEWTDWFFPKNLAQSISKFKTGKSFTFCHNNNSNSSKLSIPSLTNDPMRSPITNHQSPITKNHVLYQIRNKIEVCKRLRSVSMTERPIGPLVRFPVSGV